MPDQKQNAAACWLSYKWCRFNFDGIPNTSVIRYLTHLSRWKPFNGPIDRGLKGLPTNNSLGTIWPQFWVSNRGVILPYNINTLDIILRNCRINFFIFYMHPVVAIECYTCVKFHIPITSIDQIKIVSGWRFIKATKIVEGVSAMVNDADKLCSIQTKWPL